jgi:hypothetical protein
MTLQLDELIVALEPSQDLDSPAPVAAEPKKAEAAKAAAPAAAPAKPREASAASTLLLPIGVILVSVLIYMYYGRW